MASLNSQQRLGTRRRTKGQRGWRRHALPLRLEALEDRTLLAVVRWINPAGGEWNVPGNWNTGALPGPDDDVVIDVPGAAVTVTHPAGASSILSLVSNEKLTLSGGTLRVGGSAQVNNTFTLANGTLAG